MSDAGTTNTPADTTSPTDNPWTALRRPPDPAATARRDLETGRRVGMAITAVYVGFALLSAVAGLGVYLVGALLVGGLFAYGTAAAADSPRAARNALFVGAILGAPFGLTMLFLIRRIKEYEAALARYGRA